MRLRKRNDTPTRPAPSTKDWRQSRRFVERHAQAFGELARNLGAEYIAACEKAVTAPTPRVARARGGKTDTDGAEIEALKARVGAIVDAEEKTGTLDENALADWARGSTACGMGCDAGGIGYGDFRRFTIHLIVL